MIDGYTIRKACREYDREQAKARKVLEGYAYSLGIITSEWDKDEIEDEFEQESQWEAMLAAL